MKPTRVVPDDPITRLVRARDVNAKDLARVIALLQARERELEGGNE